MKNLPALLFVIFACSLMYSSAVAQDSSIKYIMPYETDRLFPEQLSEYQGYYVTELGINNLIITELDRKIAALEGEKQNKKTKKAIWSLEDEKELQLQLKEDLNFHLNAWLEIEEFYDQCLTDEFIAEYNPSSCYRLYTLYDTLEVGKEQIMLREKKLNAWMEYPEPTDAEYIEDVRVIKPASTKWVKKKADRNCLSADPNDCLVWCLVTDPGEVEVISRKLNILECPVSYTRSEDGSRCEKEVKYTGDLLLADRKMAVYAPALGREVEILDWEMMSCSEE